MLDNIMQSCLIQEASAIRSFAGQHSASLENAVDLICKQNGWLVVAGVGKSGHIARKIASTFRSLGRKSVFLHPSEASHGDLGLVEDDGLVLALSNSGETSELSDLIAFCTNRNVPLISITSSAESTLAKASETCIAYGHVEEACINGLAPTVSTTLALAIGDALAVGVSHAANLTAEDFRRYHPGGKLGVRLRKVSDVMHTGTKLPIVDQGVGMGQAIAEMAAKSLGCVLLQDNDGFHGIITDGDIRRNAENLFQMQPIDIVTTHPITVASDIGLDEAAAQLTNAKVSVGVIMAADRGVLGLIHIHQCVTA